jgi:2-methylcitrate dehydratase PrpD
MIKAHEIQGVLALENSFNRVGSTTCCWCAWHRPPWRRHMLGRLARADRQRAVECLDRRRALRTYRHAPNTGSRKSWAAGDATSRAVRHALFALKNEMGYPRR